jgi:hypothetical protein
MPNPRLLAECESDISALSGVPLRCEARRAEVCVVVGTCVLQGSEKDYLRPLHETQSQRPRRNRFEPKIEKNVSEFNRKGGFELQWNRFSIRKTRSDAHTRPCVGRMQRGPPNERAPRSRAFPAEDQAIRHHDLMARVLSWRDE